MALLLFPATAEAGVLLPTTMFVPFSGTSARAYLGVEVAVVEQKRRGPGGEADDVRSD